MTPSAKKVLFSTHVGKPGGAEIKMLELLQCVEQPEVLIFEDGPLATQIRALGTGVHLCNANRGMDTFKRDSGLLKAIRVMPSLIEAARVAAHHARRADIVVCMSQKSFVIFSLAKLLHRKPIIWFMNDIVTGAHFSAVSRSIMRLLSRYFANAVVLNSQSSLREWRSAKMHNSNEVVIYSGVNVAQTVKAAPTTELSELTNWRGSSQLIGMFGRITHWKGQHILIQALQQLPDCKAIIVGGAHFEDDSYATGLKSLADEYNVSDRLLFLGHKSNIFDYMQLCDAIVHCSVLPEPFGRVIAEAMLCRKIVVATAAGGVTEIIADEHTGFLYPPGDSEALARKIRKALTIESKNAMEAAAYARAADYFSSEKMCDDFKHLLSTI